jgi:ribose/xylose/arabinose/galactoside ABC-type transport system permease subunit
VWIALVLLLLACVLLAPAALNTISLRIETSLTGVLIIATLGELLVMTTGGIDVSAGAIMTVAAVIMVKTTNGLDSRMWPVAGIAVLICLAIGLVNGVIVAVLRINALIVTLSMAGILAGAVLIWAGTNFSSSGQTPATLQSLTHKTVGPVSLIVVIALVLGVATAAALHNTRRGRELVAIGCNPVAARALGMRVIPYQVSSYTIAGGLYAAAGIILGGFLRQPDVTLGDSYQLVTIVAVALAGASLAGGPSSVLSIFAACFFLTLLNEFLAVKSYSAGVQVMTQGLVLIAAVALVTAGGGRRFLPFRSARAGR